MAVHDLLKGREYNRNKAMEGFDEVDDPRIARAVHQGGYADVLLRPTMVGILRCGKMLPPQLNLVIEIEFADATTALWSENAGAHPAGATLSTDFEIQNVRVLASQVVLDSALVESFNRVLLSGRSLVFSYRLYPEHQASAVQVGKIDTWFDPSEDGCEVGGFHSHTKASAIGSDESMLLNKKSRLLDGGGVRLPNPDNLKLYAGLVRSTPEGADINFVETTLLKHTDNLGLVDPGNE